MSFESEYRDLIIKQYWDKPNARSEIELQAGTWGRIFELLKSFPLTFDVDLAVGAQLDVVGKIVGIEKNPAWSEEYYRLIIKVKIAKNNASAYMLDGTQTTVQDTIIAAFNGEAYILDNQNMTSTIYISQAVDLASVDAINALGLIPHGMGVEVFIVQSEVGATFGFSQNPNSKGFSSKFDITRIGGIFARKVL